MQKSVFKMQNLQNFKNLIVGSSTLENIFYNVPKANFSKRYVFNANQHIKYKSFNALINDDDITYNINDLENKSLINKDLLPHEEKTLSNISYISDYQDPIKDYTVDKTLPKCGVEHFYPNGNPPLPYPKKIQDVINQYIKEEIEKGNEEMQNKFVCVMTDKHFNHFHEICNVPSVALNILPFKFRRPTDEEIKEVFDADTKNGNIALAVADCSTKKILGCLGVRFRHANMPSKHGGYKDIIVPEVWAKMSKSNKGMLKLLRKFQEQLYQDGFQITYARVGYNNNTDFHEPTKKYLKMVPSFAVPGNVESNVMVQLFYGYKDKTKDEISKDEHYFLNGLALQIANIKPTDIKQNKEYFNRNEEITR